MNKKKNLRLALLLWTFPQILNAQVLNAGFETARPDGTAANWETRLVIAVPLGTEDSCNTEAFCTLTNDAYAGKKALLLQNLSCYGELIYGRIFASDDIPAYAPSIPFAERPDFFSFYYKLFPNGGEGIRMEAILSDANGTMMGTADTVFYPGTISTYARVQVPVHYWDATQPERLFLRFNFIDSLGGNTYMQPGSRLLLDEISAGKQVTGIGERQSQRRTFHCYPVPASDFVSCSNENAQAAERYTVLVTDVSGKLVKKQEQVTFTTTLRLDTHDLPCGLYFIRALNADKQFNSRFLINR